MTAVGTEAGRCVEVAARHQGGYGAVGQGDRHQGIDRFVSAAGVVFVDADQAVAGSVDHEVCIPQACCRVGLGRKRFRFDACRLTVEALIVEVGEVDHAVVNREVAPAVFADPGAHIERPGRHVGSLTIRGAAHDDPAAALGGAGLQPVNVAAVQGDAAEAHGLGHDGLGGDRRLPGTVGGDGGHYV